MFFFILGAYTQDNDGLSTLFVTIYNNGVAAYMIIAPTMLLINSKTLWNKLLYHLCFKKRLNQTVQLNEQKVYFEQLSLQWNK